MAPAGKKASKPVFKTDVPFAETKWPKISAPDQDIILDLVCNLIQPLGLHRASHHPPSKGKKRKRKTPSNTDEDIDITDAPPPPPPIGEYLLVGLNTTTRHLESLAAINAPSTISKTKEPSTLDSEKAQSISQPKGIADLAACKEQDASTATKSTNTSTMPVSALAQVSILILPTPTPQTSLAHSHLPTLLYLSSPASRANPKTSTPSASPSTTPAPAPRLILLPPSSESRLATALGIPRVGALAILENAPGANTLVEYCQEKVGTVECAWVEEGMRADWNGVKGSF